jgi:tRNA(Ile)-lysidine synthase
MREKKETIYNKEEQQKNNFKTKKTLPLQVENYSRTLINEPWINDFLKKFSIIIKNKLCLSSGDKVILAVSGGVDSIVMLDAFSVLSLQTGLILSIVHFNHCLRENSSDIDEKFVKQISHHYGLPFHSTRGDVKSFAAGSGMSIEQAARHLRYAYFEKIANSVNAQFVATAHTAEDSAETFLINLIRGSGITGLSGISSKRLLTKKVSVIRPLLNFHKEDLIKYAQLRNLKWNEDETNELLMFTRNKVRKILIPLLKNEFNPSITDTINRTALHIEGADRFISEHTENAINYLRFDKKTEKLSIRIIWFKSFSNFMQGEILHEALETYFRITPQSLSVIDRIISLSDSSTGAFFDISPTVYALKDRDYIYIGNRKPNESKEIIIDPVGVFELDDFKLTMKEVKKKEIKFDLNPNVEFFDKDKIPQELAIRLWKAGDVFHPLGANGSMKLSDFLINEKINLIEKRSIKVLCAGKEIIWVLGKRISDKYKITENTKNYLKASLSSK